MCPVRVDPRIAINMDPPRHVLQRLLKNHQQGKGLFTSDQVLFTDQRSRSTVNLFANNEGAFRQAFISAITKLGRVGVKTGNAGEIRRGLFTFQLVWCGPFLRFYFFLIIIPSEDFVFFFKIKWNFVLFLTSKKMSKMEPWINKMDLFRFSSPFFLCYSFVVVL